jgi:WD40 repeat protein
MRIVTGSRDGTAKVRDARTGTPQLELKGHTKWVKAMAFSADGTRIVTGSDDETTKVWDARTYTPQLELKMKPGDRIYGDRAFRPGGVAFSPDGTRIVAVGTAPMTFGATAWDARTGTPNWS